MYERCQQGLSSVIIVQKWKKIKLQTRNPLKLQVSTKNVMQVNIEEMSPFTSNTGSSAYRLSKKQKNCFQNPCCQDAHFFSCQEYFYFRMNLNLLCTDQKLSDIAVVPLEPGLSCGGVHALYAQCACRYFVYVSVRVVNFLNHHSFDSLPLAFIA